MFLPISHVRNTENLNIPGEIAQDGNGSDTRLKQETINEIVNIYQFREVYTRGDR